MTYATICAAITSFYFQRKVNSNGLYSVASSCMHVYMYMYMYMYTCRSEEVKESAFFTYTNWDDVLAKKVTNPTCRHKSRKSNLERQKVTLKT